MSIPVRESGSDNLQRLTGTEKGTHKGIVGSNNTNSDILS
jgi:hypothetical protein